MSDAPAPMELHHVEREARNSVSEPVGRAWDELREGSHRVRGKMLRFAQHDVECSVLA